VLRQLAVSTFDESEDEVKRREYHQVRLEKEYLSKDKPMLKEETKAIQTKSMATTCYYNPDLVVMNSGHFKKKIAVLEDAFHLQHPIPPIMCISHSKNTIKQISFFNLTHQIQKM
jgi:hypothetical protein